MKAIPKNWDLKKFLELTEEQQREYGNKLLEIEEKPGIVALYYHLTSHQSYSQHRKAANRKFMDLMRTGEVTGGHYTAKEIVFPYDATAHNIVQYTYILN
jgi:hypothetical protein